jgi:hypothetical protein
MTILPIWDNPCIQTTTETLTVFYNVINELADLADYPGFSQVQLDRLQQHFWIGETSSSFSTKVEVSNFPASVINSPNFVEDLSSYSNARTHRFNGSPTIPNSSYGSVAYEDGVISTTDSGLNLAVSTLGRLLGSVILQPVSSTLNRMAPALPIVPNLTSAIQNTFARNSMNIEGSYSIPSAEALGIGEVVFDDNDTWQNVPGLAKKYRIEITSGGQITNNEVEYKLHSQWHTGDVSASGFPVLLQVPNQKTQSGETSTGETFAEQHGANYWGDSYTENIIEDFPNLVKFKIPEFITWDETGLTFNNIAGLSQVHLDTANEPTFTASNIKSVKVFDDYEILIACRTTGLWKVTWNESTRSFDSISNITTSTGALTINPAVCWTATIKKSDQSIWAIYNNSTDTGYVLVKSLDKGATWAEMYDDTTATKFSITGLTNVANVYPVAITIDPVHIDDKFLISYSTSIDGRISSNSSTSDTYSWWTRAGSNPASDAITNSISGTFLSAKYKGIDNVVCTKSGIWIVAILNSTYGNLRFNAATARFGETFSGQKTTPMVQSILPKPVLVQNGDDESLLLEFGRGIINTNDWNTTITGPILSNSLFNLTLSPSLSYDTRSTENSIINPLSKSRVLLHLGDNLFLSAATNAETSYPSYPADMPLLMAYNDSPFMNTFDYGLKSTWGWNGANWELGNINSKIATQTRESLIDGIGVTFTDAGVGSFIAGESYDTYVYDGILKDNVTALTNLEQHSLLGFHGTVSISSTIPPSTNALTTEPMYKLYDIGDLANGFTGATTYSKAGYHYAKGNECNTIFEHELSGDFEISMKVVNHYSTGWSESLTRCFFTIADTVATDYTLYNTTSATTWTQNERFYPRDQNGPVGSLGYMFSYDNTISNTTRGIVTDHTYDDNWVLSVNAGVATWTRSNTGGDQLFYTSPVARTETYRPVIVNANTLSFTLDKSQVTFIDSRCLVDITDGVVGNNETKFRKIITTPPLRNKNSVFINGSPAIINYDTVIPPAPGEVNLLPYSGRLLCNPADVGSTITGQFVYAKDIT